MMRVYKVMLGCFASSSLLWGIQGGGAPLRPATVLALTRIDAMTQRIQFLERRQRYTVLSRSERAAINSELTVLRHKKAAEEARLKRTGEDPALWALHPNKDDLALAQTSARVPLLPESPAMPGSHAMDDVSPWTLPPDTERVGAADPAVDRAQSAIDRTAAKVDNATQKANDQAAAKADQAAAKADQAASKADQVATKADKASDKAASKAEKAAAKADKGAGKAK